MEEGEISSESEDKGVVVMSSSLCRVSIRDQKGIGGNDRRSDLYLLASVGVFHFESSFHHDLR